jgi:lipopolysaccharide transport system permease protein
MGEMSRTIPHSATGDDTSVSWYNVRLLWLLILREIKLRYTQTIGGFLWAIIQPLALTCVFTLLFSRTLGITAEFVTGMPYPLFALIGVLPWTMFATGLTRSTCSLVNDWPLVKKSALPRILLPLSGAISPVVDFAVSFVLVFALMLVWRVPFRLTILVVPLLLSLGVAFCMGLGLWLSAINARYRDVGWGLPFAIWMGMLVSPVAYSSSLVLERSRWQFFYTLNPMAGTIEGCRWAILGYPCPTAILLRSAVVALVVLVTGLWFFRTQTKVLADII